MSETEQAARWMTPQDALRVLARGNDWLNQRLRESVACDCNACFLCAYRTVETALDAAPRVEGWQPIATAPKDKILWLYEQETRTHYLGWWYPGGGYNGEGCFAYEGESIGLSRRKQPTHWKLPDYPVPPRETGA